eukprot:scaffold14297_cov113-Skeletonema_dohrnii-CCMP3373.AAC.4
MDWRPTVMMLVRVRVPHVTLYVCSHCAGSPTEGGEEESLYITTHEITSLTMTMESNQNCCLSYPNYSILYVNEK